MRILSRLSGGGVIRFLRKIGVFAFALEFLDSFIQVISLLAVFVVEQSQCSLGLDRKY